MSTTAFDDQYRTDEYSEISDSAPSVDSSTAFYDYFKSKAEANTAAEITAYFASLK